MPPKELPMGFLAIDLTVALQDRNPKIQLFDPDARNAPVDSHQGQHPSKGNGAIGTDASAPEVIVTAYGGSDLVYIPASVSRGRARKLARQLVDALLKEDYVSGLFSDRERLGQIDGTLSLADVGLAGGAVTPIPAIVVNFRSFGTGCEKPELCAAEVADSRLQQGQGMHGSFSRADTWNFIAARGPDFRTRYTDELPASTADIGMTIAHLLQLEMAPKGSLVGRVLTESLREQEGVPESAVTRRVVESRAAANGLKTILKTQAVGSAVYYDSAGFQGRTVGIE